MHQCLQSWLLMLLETMQGFLSLLAASVALVSVAHGAPTSGPSHSTANLVVDLGYARYNGTANATNGINTWLG